MSVRELEPKALWNYFADLNAVPRASKKEERVIQFMLNFGKSLGLETCEDRIHNVIIKKPATPGMENRKTVILQSHLDMVHQKNNATEFDFDTQGIDMIVESDWVRARGTTLGADNGIGVAAIMAVLASKDIPHPAIEALFTIDEETGMTGAMQLDGSLLNGEILLNLDTEDDDELSIGCAGGIDTNTSYEYESEAVERGGLWYRLTVKGLLGGHSGMDIDKGRGNANKIMNRLLYAAHRTVGMQLLSLEGGSLRNAIPRESVAHLVVKGRKQKEFEAIIAQKAEAIKEEFKTIEKDLEILLEEGMGEGHEAVKPSELDGILNVLAAVHNGVFRMSPDIEGLVEASSSLAKVSIANGEFTTQSLQRSSVESTKRDVALAVRSAFELQGSEVVQGGEYPGWQPNPNSEILKLMASMYREHFREEPQIKACHAGLECGILLQHLPNVDMISFGPNIRAAHSPDECVQISSVQKFWEFYLSILAQIPQK